MEHQKYPRTLHLPWSPGCTSDDKIMPDCSSFEGQEVIISLKMDGENSTMRRDCVHARSLDSRGGADRAWLKQFWSNIAHEIPDGWRICGENLWAKHSIHYQDLKSYFYGFNIWNEKNECLSWDDTLQYFEALGIDPVPVIYSGIWDEALVRKIEKELDLEKNEGYVVRMTKSFKYQDFNFCVAKFVRAAHVQSDKHWRHQEFIVNGLT